MNNDLEKRIRDAMLNPRNMGEMAGADSVGTVGNSECGEMLRMWVKFREENGKKVIDRATFSPSVVNRHRRGEPGHRVDSGKNRRGSPGIKDRGTGRRTWRAAAMKIHCAQLVEGALRSALTRGLSEKDADASRACRKFKPAGTILRSQRKAPSEWCFWTRNRTNKSSLLQTSVRSFPEMPAAFQ